MTHVVSFKSGWANHFGSHGQDSEQGGCGRARNKELIFDMCNGKLFRFFEHQNGAVKSKSQELNIQVK